MDDPLRLHTEKPKTTTFLSQKKKKKSLFKGSGFPFFPLACNRHRPLIKLSHYLLIQGRNCSRGLMSNQHFGRFFFFFELVDRGLSDPG
jgi:hypothetical protein